jgi:hypothetical protein
MDRFWSGEKAVVFSQFGIKVAATCPPGLVDARRLGELVARNRGVDVRVFLDHVEAEQWLLGEQRG